MSERLARLAALRAVKHPATAESTSVQDAPLDATSQSSGKRKDLGVQLTRNQIRDDSPTRELIYGSGSLPHDPRGENHGFAFKKRVTSDTRMASKHPRALVQEREEKKETEKRCQGQRKMLGTESNPESLQEVPYVMYGPGEEWK